MWAVGQNPSGQQRKEWIEKTFPTVNVHLVVDIFTDEMDAKVAALGDEEATRERLELSSQMWATYAEDILKGSKVDVVFSSEEYGDRWARILGADHKIVDLNRTYLPISGTDIRNDPYLHWSYINRYARQHYLKRVLVVGPESCGKTTLCKNLANRYGTVYSPEYGRIYDEQTRKPKEEFDKARWRVIYSNIVNEQPKLDRRAEEDARFVCFYDTDLLTTAMWYEEWMPEYGHDGLYRSILEEAARQPKYDLVLVQNLAPWVDDGMRGQTEEVRKKFYGKLLNDHKNDNLVILRGSWEQRESQAVRAINSYLFEETKATLPKP